MAQAFNPLSIPTSFSSPVSVTRLFGSLEESPQTSPPRDSNPRRHSACDECRQRKLKCSGQPAGCDRCVKQQIECHYSEQKQMGRPRKRQKTDDPPPTQSTTPPRVAQSPSIAQYPELTDFANLPIPECEAEPPIDPSLSAIHQEHTDFANICSGPIAQSIRDLNGPHTFNQQRSHFGHPSQHAEFGEKPAAADTMYPLDITMWPDYSNFDLPMPMREDTEATNLPYPTPSHSALTDVSWSTHDPDVNPAALNALPAAPACPCLPNLYLTLSTLSTLTSFPVSSHTIETLLVAHKTAHSVIYCHVCPRTFQGGSQNLMLGCTLLNVLADHWHRIRRTQGEDLKRGFARNDSPANATGTSVFVTTKEGQTWRQFSADLIRAYVFGDQAIPIPPGSLPTKGAPQIGVTSNSNLSSSTDCDENGRHQNMVPSQYALMSLIEALNRRQRQWHDMDEPTDEFPDRCSEGYAHLYTHHQPTAQAAKRHNKNKGKVQAKSASYCKIHGRHSPSAKDNSKSVRTNGDDPVDMDIVNTSSEACNDISQSQEANGEKPGEVGALDTDSNGGHGHRHGHEQENDNDNDDEGSAQETHEEHALCLMMIKHSMDIVKNLDCHHI